MRKCNTRIANEPHKRNCVVPRTGSADPEERSSTLPEATAPASADAKKDKDATIIVNAEEHTVEDENVSFDTVTKFAYPSPPYGDTLFTVTYRNAHKPKEGTLVEGQSVEVKKQGTIFNVKATDKS